MQAVSSGSTPGTDCKSAREERKLSRAQERSARATLRGYGGDEEYAIYIPYHRIYIRILYKGNQSDNMAFRHVYIIQSVSSLQATNMGGKQ